MPPPVAPSLLLTHMRSPKQPPENGYLHHQNDPQSQWEKNLSTVGKLMPGHFGESSLLLIYLTMSD